MTISVTSSTIRLIFFISRSVLIWISNFKNIWGKTKENDKKSLNDVFFYRFNVLLYENTYNLDFVKSRVWNQHLWNLNAVWGLIIFQNTRKNSGKSQGTTIERMAEFAFSVNILKP